MKFVIYAIRQKEGILGAACFFPKFCAESFGDLHFIIWGSTHGVFLLTTVWINKLFLIHTHMVKWIARAVIPAIMAVKSRFRRDMAFLIAASKSRRKSGPGGINSRH